MKENGGKWRKMVWLVVEEVIMVRLRIARSLCAEGNEQSEELSRFQIQP